MIYDFTKPLEKVSLRSGAEIRDHFITEVFGGFLEPYQSQVDSDILLFSNKNDDVVANYSKSDTYLRFEKIYWDRVSNEYHTKDSETRHIIQGWVDRYLAMETLKVKGPNDIYSKGWVNK